MRLSSIVSKERLEYHGAPRHYEPQHSSQNQKDIAHRISPLKTCREVDAVISDMWTQQAHWNTAHGCREGKLMALTHAAAQPQCIVCLHSIGMISLNFTRSPMVRSSLPFTRESQTIPVQVQPN